MMDEYLRTRQATIWATTASCTYPAVGRFLSADPIIQDAGNTQNYNRYSYCLNNPLKYTDPSGYQIRKSDADAWAEAMTDRNDYFMINSGGGSVIGDWFNAYTSASRDGYTRGVGAFLDEYDKQLYSPDYDGTMSFQSHYFTHSNYVDEKGVPTAVSKRYDFTINLSGQGSFDGMDYVNYAISSIGTIVDGTKHAVGAAKNQRLWTASYKTSKALKSVGVNVQTRVIKHGAKTVLANASRNIAIAGAGLSLVDIAMDGQVNASHLLNLGMVGVSTIPIVGWITGGVYLASDVITLGVSGKSIGQHLDNYVGGSLYDF